MQNLIVSITVGILIAAFGCWLAQVVIPAGTPRLLAEVLSVAAGVAPAALYRGR